MLKFNLRRKKTTPVPTVRPAPPLTAVGFNWLLPALALTLAPHTAQLPLWLSGLFIVAALWRWRAAYRRYTLPPRWLLLTLTIAAGAGVLVNYGTLLGRDAGVALLVAMSALKLLEASALRDGMVLVFLGYFLVMANLLYTQDLPMALYLLPVLAVLLAAQTVIQPQHQALARSAPLRLSGRMLTQGLPVMLVLFILFPRIPGPLWGLPRDAHSGLTGLDDKMTPGSISELIQSDEVAFRARFNGVVPPVGQLYWRGPVLIRFDGRSWEGMIEPITRDLPFEPQGSALDYTVTLEPHGQHWLFALDLPAQLPPDARFNTSLMLVSPKPVNDILRYEMRSYPQYRTGELTPWEQAYSTRLPGQGNPRTRQLAAELQQRYPDPAERVGAALRMFREEPFYYTTRPPLLGDDSVDEFLYDTRRGFCEHYASSFTFLMRAAGVPARVVTGYQGGEYNEMSGYFVVRQSDAHAWAEVWLAGRGWVRVDPTAQVSPARIEQGMYAATADDQVQVPLFARRDSALLRQLALSWDYLDSAWNEWVLAYGPERQKEFLSGFGFGPVDWGEMTVAMIAGLGLIVLAYAGWYGLQRQRRLDPATRAYRAFCAKLARRGLPRQAHEGPLGFSDRVASARPELADSVRTIGRLYTALHYGTLRDPHAPERLKRLVQGFKP